MKFLEHRIYGISSLGIVKINKEYEMTLNVFLPCSAEWRLASLIVNEEGPGDVQTLPPAQSSGVTISVLMN
jgi:hypothetical protein